MYNNEATAHGKLHLKSLLICWGIIERVVTMFKNKKQK